MIDIKNLNKSFNGKCILSDISVTFETGKTNLIIGRSGSGKTVLASQIAGDIQLKGGDVKFHDPEARLNPTFAKMFGLESDKSIYEKMPLLL